MLRTRFPSGFESAAPCAFFASGRPATSPTAISTRWSVPRRRASNREVLSYYTVSRQPIGRWHVQACRNVSCSLMGSERILEHLTKKLGIGPGQTTADGRFTLSTVECVASCGTAPVVVINETCHESVSPAKLDALLEALP